MKTPVYELTEKLIGNLWNSYLRRVPYARTYKKLVESMGGSVKFDHLAFRTLNTTTGEQPAGILSISHLLKHLGYLKAGTYRFEKQKLSAAHFEHPDGRLPLIFVSQLEVKELPNWALHMIHDVVDDSPYVISDTAIELMNCLAAEGTINREAAEILVEELTGYFRRPWKIPSIETMLKINDISQYAAWVLLHGNSVNHFAASVISREVTGWPDLESTCMALKEAGVPMKREIEGDLNSQLRQSATMPVIETYRFPDLKDDFDEMEWTYAYLELTERGYSGTGDDRKRFTGFITEQASHLFNLTQTRKN